MDMDQRKKPVKLIRKSPPRPFQVGQGGKITISDCGKIQLNSNEQVTFILPSGAEYDVTRKEWGFYATPSLNGRLEQFGLRGVLIKNRVTGRFFVLLVEKGKEAGFEDYCRAENLVAVAWLDSKEALEILEKRMSS
jgi:hypothetical protein